MLQRGSKVLAAGVLSMSGLLAGCQVMPTACPPGLSYRQDCQSCSLPCSLVSCWCGYNRCFDEHAAKHAAYWEALRHLRSVPECLASNVDYRAGFIEAFQDVATGRPGIVPAMPPRKYWNACFRAGRYADKVQDWYAGYAAGAEMARCCYLGNEVQLNAPGYPPSTTGHSTMTPQRGPWGP